MKKYLIILVVFSFFISHINYSFAEGNGIQADSTKMNTKNIKGIQSKTVNDLFSGAGVYSLPMNFPKGPKNINLGLQLGYNSYSTDSFSPYGYAWDLGLPRINRDSKKGIAGMYSSNDFIANGSDLILIDELTQLYKSKYTNNLNKYYFENNSWRVLDSRGNTYYYGTDENSKLSDPLDTLKTYSWSLNKQIDNRGNEINYNYFKDNNQVYLSDITYAGGLYKVELNYIDKARSLTSYRTQFKVKTSKLLSEVVLYIDNVETKKYELLYDDPDSVFSHLMSFEEKSGLVTQSKHDFSYGTGKNTHLLEEISDNKGLQVHFEYKPSVFYTDTAGNNLNPKLPFNMKTLNKITYLDTVTGLSNTQTFIYAGGSFYFDTADLYGRQYAGFNKVTKTDSKGIKEIYYFHQGANSADSPELGEFEDHISKKGKIYRIEMYDTSNNIIKSDITKWKSEFEGENRWKVLKQRETKSLINGSNITSSAVEYSYDIYANILEQVNYGEVNKLNEKGDFVDIKTDKKVTKLTYSQNDSKNLYGFMKSQELYDFNNILSNKKELLYDTLTSGSVDFGDVTSVKIYYNESEYSEQQSEYNTGGLVTKTINPRGYETSYVYDTYGIYPISVTNALGFSESFEYDYTPGKPSKSTNVNGLETLYEYDNFGRLTFEKVKLGSEYQTKAIVYDDITIPNNIKQTVYFDIAGTNKQEVFVYINGFGNEIETKKSYKTEFITNKTEYDIRGNKIFVSYPIYENDSTYSVLDKQTEFGVTNTYDSLDRVTKITNKTGDIVYLYDNLDFTITNQKGISTNYEYDIFGNLVQVTEPGNFETTYSYNTLGQLTKVIDSQNNIRNMAYDIAGKRSEIEDLHSQGDTNFGKRLYQYDNNGNITTYTTLSGNDITYVYDNLDRLTSESFGTNTTSYNYDIGTNSKGLLSSYSKGDYSESYSYDIQGNIISETKNYGPDNYTYNYSYNLLGQKLSDTYPDSKTTNYTFENGIAIGVNYDGVDLIKSVNYNPVGKITDMQYGNDAVSMNVFDYENGYRLTKKGLLFGTSQYGLTTYTFDDLGNITNLKEEGNIPEFQKDVSYSYDDLGRLLEADYSPSEKYNYTYDSLGNILSNSNIGSYNYSDNGRNNPHAVTNIGSINYGYDDNGNVVSDNKGNYTYNSRDELTSFTNNSGSTVSYNYNLEGIRVEKTTGTDRDRYLNKDYEIITSGTGTGQTIATSKYIFFGGSKIGTVKQGDITYHHGDHLGGANIDLDSNGTILQNVDYLPYGEIRNEYNYGDYQNKYKFTGKERDLESNLDYFEARYYGSDNGRFRSIDRVFWEVGYSKIGINLMLDPQQFNSYSYARNNPLIYTDPTGEFIVKSLSLLSKVGPKLKNIGSIARTKIGSMSISNVGPKLATYGKNINQFGQNVYKFTHKSKINWSKVNKPNVENIKLQKFINELYRPGSKIGNKSTADSIRYTKYTGNPIGGSDHVKKGQQSIRFLNKWIRSNPNAPTNDINAAKNIINDTKNALKGN